MDTRGFARVKAEANEPMRMVDDQTNVSTTSAFVAERTIALIMNTTIGLSIVDNRSAARMAGQSLPHWRDLIP